MNTPHRRHTSLLLTSLLFLLVPQPSLAQVGPDGLSESEVLKLTVGKTAEDVRSALGEPPHVVKGKNGIEHWFYPSIVRMGKGTKRFGATEVVLSSGQVNHLMNHANMPPIKP